VFVLKRRKNIESKTIDHLAQKKRTLPTHIHMRTQEKRKKRTLIEKRRKKKKKRQSKKR